MHFHVEHAVTGRQYKEYMIGDERCIGVVPGEAYQVVFNSTSATDVSVNVAVDGINILTGKPATLDPSEKRWLVRSGVTKFGAWQETDRQGARLVFSPTPQLAVSTQTENGSAHLGYIEVAVFVESSPRPAALSLDDYGSGIRRPVQSNLYAYGGSTSDAHQERGGGHDSPFMGGVTRGGATRGVGTAAGETVDSQVVHVQGLRKPVLSETFAILAMAEDDLYRALAAQTSRPRPCFRVQAGADLTNVTRVTSDAKAYSQYPLPRFVF